MEPEDPSVDEVDELLDQVLAAPDARWRDTLEQLCADYPERGVTLRARFRALEQHGIIPVSTTTTAAPGGRSVDAFGDYDLGSILGQGAMGLVFDAVHRPTGEPVALKVLRPELLDESTARRRFEHEAAAAARVEHPALCSVRAAGEVDGAPFLAMQRVVGETLATRIARARARAKAVTPSPAAAALLIEKVAQGLAALHAAGLVHRDVKPANILVTAAGEPVLCDFGLAWSSTAASLTRTGTALGTPAYMPPEQIRAAGDVTPAADVYALGASLYEALALRPPFESAQREDLYRRILAEDADDVRRANPAVPRPLAIVVACCLEKDPRRRYRDGREMADDLERVRLGRPIRARPPGALRRVARAVRRHPVRASLALAAAGFVLAAVSYAIRQQELAAAAEQLAAGAASGAASQLAGRDPVPAALLARDAFTVAPSYVTRSGLLRALRDLHQRDEIRTDEEAVWAAPSPLDGTLLVAVQQWPGQEHRPELRSMCGTWPRVLQRSGMSGAWSADGRRFALQAADWAGPDRERTRVHVGAVDATDRIGNLAAAVEPLALASDPNLWPRPRLAFDGEGCLFVGDRGGSLHALDSGGSRQVLATGPADAPVRWLFLPRGTRTALTVTGSGGAAVRATPLDGGDSSSVWELPGSLLQFAALSGDHRWLFVAVGHQTGGAEVWRIRVDGAAVNDEEPPSTRFAAAEHPVQCLAADAGGERVVFGTQGNVVVVADGDRQHLMGTPSRPWSVAFASATEGRGADFAVALYSGPILLFERGRYQPVAEFRGHRAAAAHLWFEAEGRELCSVSWDRTVRRWSLSVPGLPVLRERRPIHDIGWLPDGSIVTTGKYGHTRLWRRGGEACAETAPPSSGVLAVSPPAHPLARDGAGAEGAVIADCHGSRLRLWGRDPQSPTGLGRLQVCDTGMKPECRAMVFTRDHLLVAGWAGGRITVHAPDLSRPPWVSGPVDRGIVEAVAVDDDGGRVASAVRSLVLWNLEVGPDGPRAQQLDSWPLPRRCTAIAFVPGRDDRLVLGFEDGPLAVFGLTDAELRWFGQHEGAVNCATFSPRGDLLLTTGRDGLGRLWRAGGAGLSPFLDLPHEGDVWCGAFSSDGQVVTAGSNQQARLWPTTDEELGRLGERLPFRDFDDGERDRLLGK